MSMYGNIYFYANRGGSGRGNKSGRGRGRGGGGGDGGDGGGDGTPHTPPPKKFTGKCDLCKLKGHKVMQCPKFLAIIAQANAVTAADESQRNNEEESEVEIEQIVR
eukprot:XP_016657709.1 PREDICTED: probable H/ACA ribonucleoprotein complex subunit 1 [Acyrthosiphon pisum]